MSIDANTVQVQRVGYKSGLNKIQTKVISFSILYASIAFLLICGLGYLFYFCLEKGWIPHQTKDTLYIISGVLLIGVLITSIIVSCFNIKKWWVFLILYVLVIGAFSISFSSLFSTFNGKELLMLFGISGGVLLITAIIGFFMGDKAAMTLAKFLFILIPIYFIFSLVFGLVSIFAFHSDVLYAIMTVVSSLIVLMSNVYSFYSLSKRAEFVQLSVDQGQAVPIHTLCLAQGFNLLLSIINTVLLIARILLFTRRS